MNRIAAASLVVVALASPAHAQSKTLDAVAGEKSADGWQGWDSYAVKGDPSLQLVATPPLKTHWYDRWTNPSADVFSSEKARRDRLAALGLPVQEIRDVGTFQGRPAMIARKYPGAAFDPLHGGTDPTAHVSNVDPATTLRDLDAIESRLAALDKQGTHVDLSHLMIAKDGHVLLDGGSIDDGRGLPPPGTGDERNARVIGTLRKSALLVKGLEDSGLASSPDEARAMARDILATSIDRSKNPYAHANVAMADERDPRARAMLDLVRRVYGEDASIDARNTELTVREVAARRPTSATTRATPTPAKPTKGLSDALGDALGASSKKPR